MTAAPPFDPTSEQVVLAAALRDPDALRRLVRSVSADDCYADRHRVVWAVLREMVARDLEYDPPTFARVADAIGFVEADYGGERYLVDLADAYPDGANLDWHAATARTEARLRSSSDADGEALLAEMRRPGASASDVASIARRILSEATRLQVGDASEATRGDRAAADYSDVLQRRRSGNVENVPIGLPELDAVLTWALAPSRLTVLAGRPSNGKTSLTYNIAKWWVDRCDRGANDPRPILWLPIEMGRTATQDGLVSRAARVGSQRIIRDFAGANLSEQAEVARAVTQYVDTPWIEWFDDPGASVDRVSEVLASSVEPDPERDDRQRSRYGLVIWDLFQSSLGDLSPSAMAASLNRAQSLARTYGTHLLLVAQIRRGVEKRGDKRPNREDVKGTGGWEEVADQLLVVHRERVYDPDLEDDTMEVGVLKQRVGPFGMWLQYEYDAPTFFVGRYLGSSAE